MLGLFHDVGLFGGQGLDLFGEFAGLAVGFLHPLVGLVAGTGAVDLVEVGTGEPVAEDGADDHGQVQLVLSSVLMSDTDDGALRWPIVRADVRIA